MRIAYLLAFLFISGIGFAQAPQRFSFQAVVRHPDTSLVTYKQISVRLSILKGDINGTVVYSETHSPRTNGLGLFTLEVGGGTVQSGDFSSIAWGSDSYFIKREIDPTGGTNYAISGTSQMLSVPYALLAETARSLDGLNEVKSFYYSNGYPITIDLKTNDYNVPNDSVLFIVGRSGQCGLLIDDSAYRLSYDVTIGSNRKISKFIYGGSCSSSSDLILRAFLVPKYKYAFFDTIIRPTEFYEVPDGKILILDNPVGYELNNVKIGNAVNTPFAIFGGEKIFAVPTNFGLPSTQEIYFSGIFFNN